MENLQGGLIEGSLICRFLRGLATSELTPISVIEAFQGYYIANCLGGGY